MAGREVAQACVNYPAGLLTPTHFPIVRGSAIDGHGWSAGDARNPLRIMKLEVVARDGIEPSTRGFSVWGERCHLSCTDWLAGGRPCPPEKP